MSDLDALRAELAALRGEVADLLAFVLPRTLEEYRGMPGPRGQGRLSPKAWPGDLGPNNELTPNGRPVTDLERERLARARALFEREGEKIAQAVTAAETARAHEEARREAAERALRGDVAAIEAVRAFCGAFDNAAELERLIEGEVLSARADERVLVVIEHVRRHGSGDALAAVNERRRIEATERWQRGELDSNERIGAAGPILVACLPLSTSIEVLVRDLPTPPPGRVLVVLERGGGEPVIVDGTLEHRASGKPSD